MMRMTTTMVLQVTSAVGRRIITRAAASTQSFAKTEDLVEGHIQCPECATIFAFQKEAATL